MTLPKRCYLQMKSIVNGEVNGEANSEVNGATDTRTSIDAAQENALEQQLHALDEALLDPWQHSERERERLTLRRKQVLDDLSWCYEQRQPTPLPAYGAREGVIQVWLDIDSSDGPDEMMRVATFNSNAAVPGRVFIQQHTGHVQWHLPEDCCVLPWALERVVWGLVRIVFMHLELQVVQTQVNVPLPGFQDAGEGWQTLTRKGFMHPAAPTRRRVAAKSAMAFKTMLR